MLSSANTSSSLRRGIRRSLQQISRDRSWGATLLLLTGLMILTQLFLVFLLGVDGVGKLLTARAGIQLEVLPSAREQDIQELYAALRANPLVENVVYVPSDQAYEQQKASDPDLVAFLEEYKLENPFPDTFSVTLKSLDAYDSFAQEVQQDRWRAVVNPSFLTAATSRETQTKALLEVTEGLRTLSIAFIVVALIVLFAVVLEWVSRNAARREQELVLEHLLGAPAMTVLLPFASEMTFLLVAGALLGTAIMGIFLVLLPVFMPAFALETPFQLLQAQMRPVLLGVFPLLLLIELIAMPFLAFAGTVLGVKNRMPVSFRLMA